MKSRFLISIKRVPVMECSVHGCDHVGFAKARFLAASLCHGIQLHKLHMLALLIFIQSLRIYWYAAIHSSVTICM